MQLAECDEQSLNQQFVVQNDTGTDTGLVRLLTLGSDGAHCVRLDWLHLQVCAVPASDTSSLPPLPQKGSRGSGLRSSEVTEPSTAACDR